MRAGSRLAAAWMAGAALGAVLAFAWLRSSPAYYVASAVIGSAPLLGGGVDQAAQEAGLHLGVVVDLMRSRTGALAVIDDPELLRQVMWREWDEEAGIFRPDPSPAAAIGRWIDRMSGRQAWQPPGPEEVERRLRDVLTVGREGEAKLMHVRAKLRDREAARRLIETVVMATDAALRRREIARLGQRLQAIEAVAGTLGPLDTRRRSVADLRSGIAVRLAVLETDAPYAVTFIAPPSVPTLPTSPSPLVVVAVSTIAGGVAGALTLQGVASWPRRRSLFRSLFRR